MFDRKFLIAILLSIGTVWLFNYYTGSKSQDATPGMVKSGTASIPVPGQPLKALPLQELQKPLNLDVQFAEKKFTQPETVVEVETNYCIATFSTYGGVMTSLDFKEHIGKHNGPMRTIHTKGSVEAEQRKRGCFLVALGDQTPYMYTFVGRNDLDKKTEITFKTETEQWLLTKTYVLYKDSYKIDLLLGCEPKSQGVAAIQPRIFFATPFVGEITDDVAGVFSWNESKQTIEKYEMANVVKDGLIWYWQTPQAMFGTDDKYFIHSLIADPSQFVNRAYVKQFDAHHSSSIFQGPEISEKKEWTLSFYMGPKLTDHLDAVDPRLEEVLSFGWLSWFCKMLLKLLAWINDYVGNFGWSIIILAILLKLPFMPLSIYSRRKMEAFQRFQPSINKIRLKFRQDMKMQHEELMRFYREHNLSPATPMIGCLPLLLQLPILFALYKVLGSYLDLYQAPFIGWIVDLSSKDPYYVIPVLMGISMIWQQRMMPSGDGKQRVMMMFMSAIMTVVFSNFPAGLVLYWLVNNLLTIGEDYVRKFFFPAK